MIMLVANDLKNLLKTEMEGIDNADDACAKLGEVISEYVMNNAELTFSWIAFSSPPASTPDPVIIAEGGVTFLNIVITPSGLSDADLSIDDMCLKITNTTRATGLFNIDNTIENLFVTTPASMSSVIDLILTPSGLSDPDEALLDFCENIIDWFKTNLYTVPVSGIRAGIYTGTGLITSFQ